MNRPTWKAFRQQVDDGLEQRADALFRVCDSVLRDPSAHSLAERSLSPFFNRTWPSVSAALADGKIHMDQWQALCVRRVLAELPADALVWIAIDAPPEERPEARTSEDRGSIPVSNRPLADTPVSMRWMFSVVGLVPAQTSSWTPPRALQRISRTQTAVGVALDQRRRRTPLFGTRIAGLELPTCCGHGKNSAPAC